MRISDWSSDVCSSDLNSLPDAAEEAKSPRYWMTHRSGGKPVPAFHGGALLEDHGGRDFEALSREHRQYRRGAGLPAGRAVQVHPVGGREKGDHGPATRPSVTGGSRTDRKSLGNGEGIGS